MSIDPEFITGDQRVERLSRAVHHPIYRSADPMNPQLQAARDLSEAIVRKELDQAAEAQALAASIAHRHAQSRIVDSNQTLNVKEDACSKTGSSSSVRPIALDILPAGKIQSPPSPCDGLAGSASVMPAAMPGDKWRELLCGFWNTCFGRTDFPPKEPSTPTSPPDLSPGASTPPDSKSAANEGPKLDAQPGSCAYSDLDFITSCRNFLDLPAPSGPMMGGGPGYASRESYHLKRLKIARKYREQKRAWARAVSYSMMVGRSDLLLAASVAATNRKRAQR